MYRKFCVYTSITKTNNSQFLQTVYYLQDGMPYMPYTLSNPMPLGFTFNRQEN